jgi:hypothetical protein
VQANAPSGTFTVKAVTASGPDATWNGVSPVAMIVKPVSTPVVIQAIELQLVGPNQDLQVKVTAKDNNGVALPGVTANCYMYLNNVIWHGQTKTTGADGTFTFVQTGAPAGTFTAKIVNVTGVNMTWNGVTPVASITKVASITAVIQAIDLQWVGVNQDLQVKVTVKDSNGVALPNITANCYMYLNGVIWHGQTHTTGADGTFTFLQTGAPAGTYTVKVVGVSGPDVTWSGVSPVATITK